MGTEVVCVSLSAQLLRRMLKFRRNYPVNWSKLARQAWEKYMDQVEGKQPMLSLDEKIQRLEERIHTLEVRTGNDN